jgi:hypothetical protein
MIMKALLLTTALIAIATPAFADDLWDTCSNLANERVGPIQQTHHGHWQKFFRECVRGKIPMAAASAIPIRAPRSDNGGGPTDGEGRVLCVTGTNGQKYCR